MSELSDSVTYHRPRDVGTCDDCEGAPGYYSTRATHRLDTGEDVCGYHYGVRQGYITEDD